MVCNNHECRTNSLKMVNLVKTVADLQTAAKQKDRVITVLSDRVNKYFERYGLLSGDDDGVPQMPGILLDSTPAGIRAHTSTEAEAIPPTPSILLGK